MRVTRGLGVIDFLNKFLKQKAVFDLSITFASELAKIIMCQLFL